MVSSGFNALVVVVFLFVSTNVKEVVVNFAMEVLYVSTTVKEVVVNNVKILFI
jgi:hypothetical protein